MEMDIRNVDSSSTTAKRKRKRNRKSNARICNSSQDSAEGASIMPDIPQQSSSCAESIVGNSSNSGLIEECTVVNSGMIEEKSSSDVVHLENKRNRKKKNQKHKRHNPPIIDDTDSTVEALGDTSRKTELPADPVKTNASVDTGTKIDLPKKLSRSQKRKMKKKSHNDNLHVLENGPKDFGPPGNKSQSDSSLQPSFDVCSKNELVMKQLNGGSCLCNGHNASENDRVVNLQMNSTKCLEKVDTKTVDFAAALVGMNNSVDTRTMMHFTENWSRSKRRRMRKKLRKQGACILEHDPKNCFLLEDSSRSKNMFLEKNSPLQSPVDLCSETELLVKQSNGDVCLFSGRNASENDVQMTNSEKLGNKEIKHIPEASLAEKDVHTESNPISSETRPLITYERKKRIKTYFRKNGKQCSNSLVNSLNCVEEDGDSLMQNVAVLPEVKFEQKGRRIVDKIEMSISDEIPSHPKGENKPVRDRNCKLRREHFIEAGIKRAEACPSSHLDDVNSDATGKKENPQQTLYFPHERVCTDPSKKKLLVLDVNGLLADIVQSPSPKYKPDLTVSKKAVFKRPYCDEFLQFCFERYNVGVWSSRVKKNLDKVIDFLMGNSRKNLLFCWDASHCSKTGLNTLENKKKPLVLKELNKLWEKREPSLPWEKGEYNETNTLLLDDSPYKALCNPAHTAIFPHPYDYRNAKDCSLGRGGEIRVYLEALAADANVQEYVRQNPFGQRSITESNPSWGFYCKVFNNKSRPPPYGDCVSKITGSGSCQPRGDGNSEATNAKSCEPHEEGDRKVISAQVI